MIGFGIDIVKSLAMGWIEKKKIRNEADIEIIKKQSQADIDWESINSKNARTSWKDEYLIIILTSAGIMAFIPGLQEHALKGFEILDSMPVWYRYYLGVAITASFGTRYERIFRLRKNKE